MPGHTGTRDVRNAHLAWTPLTKPLSECVVTLFTIGGVHLKSDQPFDLVNSRGDWTFREIPTDIATSELMVTHSHYSHVDADRDINCMFPRLAQDYKAFMEARVAEEANGESHIPGVGRAL